MTRTVTIGEVLNRLKDEFPDVTSSQIRYYENKGLIAPDRSEGGYRKFTPGDIDRIRYVLRAQRDRYLPLDVIRDELERRDAGLPLPPPPPPPTPGDGPRPAVPPPADGSRAPTPGSHHRGAAHGLFDEGLTEIRLSLEGLAGGSGLGPRELQQLREIGLLGEGPTYDGTDLQIAKAAADLLSRGGLEPRHLRTYVRFADNEVALHAARVRTQLQQRSAEQRAEVRDGLALTAAAALQLHRALLLRSFRALLRS